MRKLLLSFFMCMLAIIGMQAETATATLSFADKAQRTSYSTTEQVWEQNGITFTNNKSSSTTNVADYANPVRLYANSEIVIEFGRNMTEIQFTCSSSSYTTALKNSITVDASATINGNTVTAVLTNPSKSFTIARLGAQVRLNSLTVTYDNTGEGGEVVTVEVPTFTPEPGSEFEGSLDVTIDVAEGLKAYYSIDNGESFTEGTALTITETTTIIAYAQDSEGNKSDRVSAKYTKNEPLLGYTIVFNNNDGGDLTTEAETSNFVTGYIKKTNIEGLTCTATSKCYLGKTDYGIKMGSSKGNGTFTLQLASAMNVESIVVNAVKYNTDAASLSVNGIDTLSLTAEFANYTFEINDEISIIKVDMTKRGYIKSLTIKLVENITAGMYYLVPGEWEDENVALYAAEFINKNTETSKFEQGYLNNHFVYFQLKEGEYTHVKFYQVENPDKSTTTTVIEDFATMKVLAETPELTYTAPGAGNIMRYNVDESDWEEVEIGTGVNRVELVGGIGYAYGVVSAEGAIEVYNVNGAVVARGNDNVDLRGLGRGVYIIRNGNQVRKVVR